METNSIKGVEIFSAGTWNGDSYTVEDLNLMVEAFDKNKQSVRPFLKLGHDEEQTLLQRDGYPAAGWIDRLYVLGEKLVADFSSIPKTIYDLIVNKAYRNVSSEIYCNVAIGEDRFKYMLGAVALLGADTPAVMNLSDIMAMYSKIKSDDVRIYNLTAPLMSEKREAGMPTKTEAEIKLELDLKAKLDEIEAIKKDFSKSQEEAKAQATELETLRKEKEEAIKSAKDAEKKVIEANIEKFTSELVTQKLSSVAMKPLVAALLGDEKKEYSFGEKSLSKQEVIAEMLKLFKAHAEVNFEENSSVGVDDKKNDDKETHEKILAYAAEHKISYGQATKAIISQKK
jgi:hypothetical protein